MKKLFILIVSSCLLTACSTTEYVQIVDVRSASVPLKGDNYVYADDNCIISYNFWGRYGNPGFVIENLTDELLYVNLAHSFYTTNGMANDYFLNRSFGIGKSSVSSVGNSVSASAYGIWAFSNLPGSKTVNKTAAASLGTMTNTTYEEKEIAIIPPHYKKYFSEYSILGDVIQDCSLKLFPKKNKPESIRYQQEDSPLVFGNYISYKVGENGQYRNIKNDFFVSGFSNYKLDDVKEKHKLGCNEQLTVNTNKYQKGTSFYVPYNNKHKKDFSKDASKAPAIDTNFYDALY